MDEDTFVSGEGGVLSGEVTLNVASASLESYGVYLRLRGEEKAYKKQGKSEVYSLSLALLLY